MAENPLANYEKLDPDMIKHVHESSGFALGDGALPKKFKLLIAMALDASHGAVNGVRSLATQAKAAGATKEEITETIRVAAHVHGAGCLYTAAAAFRGLDL